jgi:hypothetical protein
MLKQLQIRYQTARSLPAPYAYFYTLAVRPLPDKTVQVDLAITYPDRDDIDDDELIAEGYTRDDDFSWSGQLPRAWLQVITELVNKTQLEPVSEDLLEEDDEFWAISLETDNDSPKQGQPRKPDSWQYLVQELIQATYEAIGRERPFELIFLDFINPQGDLEIRLTASFVERTVDVVTGMNRKELTRTIPWSALQRVMTEVYTHDYDADDAQTKRPKRDGQWLNLGGEEWFDVSEFPTLATMFGKL